MVFHQSDSTGTLVSLDQQVNKHDGELLRHDDDVENDVQHRLRQQYVQTSLLLEIDEADECKDDEDSADDCWMGHHDFPTSSSAATSRVPLYLPVANTTSSSPSIKVDEYLNQLPYFQDKCDELLSLPPRVYTGTAAATSFARSDERILYCNQGERVSSTSTQNDVIVTDRATTCHILAMRSTTTTSSLSSPAASPTQPPMASMAHLDGVQYSDCVRSMVREHVTYHSNDQSSHDEKVSLEVHVVGGFNDEDGTSSELSEWLIRLLADLASDAEFRDTVSFVLKTCAITTMNDTGYQCPVGRGLAMNIRTGQIYLARCDDDATGPASVLRSVYLWTSRKHLRVVHSALDRTSRLIIEPFEFRPFEHISALLKLDDRSLLKNTSTSPDVEEDGFCNCVRRSLRFLQHVPCEQVFGLRLDQPLIFERRSNTSNNGWKLVQQPMP